jgi:N-acetylglucosaminyl-diphospho-decaprenol L-rhamnosyltransferase
VHDLAVIVVSTNEAHWVRPCLRTVEAHLGDVDADLVVVDNDSTDGTAQMVAREYPRARVVPSANHGFSHANNRALMTCTARYLLLLNPDTEVVDGTFADLVAYMDARPGVGLIGVRQILPDGTLHPTIRRFPNAGRALGEALGAERLPVRAPWLGERELDLSVYDRDVACDWTTGSFLLIRREALEGVGFLDERFFMSSEEVDLCFRIKRAGWDIRHTPAMTIVHHAGKRGIDPRMDAQYAWARKQYSRKHLSVPHRGAYLGALMARHALRAALAPMGDSGLAPSRRAAAARCLRTLAGKVPPPFGRPPATAVRPRTAGNDDTPRRLDGATRLQA